MQLVLCDTVYCATVQVRIDSRKTQSDLTLQNFDLRLFLKSNADNVNIKNVITLAIFAVRT